ncbi:MAG: PorP/SprF family type IX secretion system membrane protein [Bacteroidota bacterium]
MKQLIRSFAILFLMGWMIPLQGQDPHFSQYFNSAIGINPAQIGHFDGKIRLNGAYRRQWANIADAFQTSSASIDAPLGNIGLGLEFVDDQAGMAGLRHTNALLGLAYHRPFGRHRLSLGVKGGFIQKSIDPTQLSFDSQYSPPLGFDPSLPNLETLPIMRLTVGDLHSGIGWSFANPEANLIRGAYIRAALAHVNRPVISLLGDEEVHLPVRTSLSVGFNFLGGERLSILPSLIYLKQGQARELTGGVNVHYRIDEGVIGQFGVGVRNGDAVIPYVGLAYQGLLIGLSYDINTSLLSGFTNMQGGPELSLSYIWDGDIAARTRPAPKLNNTRTVNDQDGDGIRDRNDRCPDIPGLKRYGGCPDSDGDGVIDQEDDCPTLPGPRIRGGCPAEDRDGDGILDKADECPEIPGLIAFKGCPDSDNDGLPDQVDKCPNEAGPRIRSGCPSSDIDADGDGIPDKIDMCPQTVGLTEFQGCPDTDRDGIPDFEDLCPSIKGEKMYKGCPTPPQPQTSSYSWQPQLPYQQQPCQSCPPTQAADADRDGTLDHLDKCPMVAGPPQLQGCPDSDQDGISDFEDRCPFTAGRRELQGCPDNNNNWDADGDGILNQVDKCPYVVGLPAFQGCPDTDKDGLSDLEDACPLIYGPVATRGCPNQSAPAPLSSQGSPIREQTFGPVLFDTDKAIIKQHYFSMLDELALYLQTHPTQKLMIGGHTDHEGNEMYNMVLGQNRAKAITYYLESKGVGRERISILSYGENLPVDTNRDPRGRANNRRVELNLVK